MQKENGAGRQVGMSDNKWDRNKDVCETGVSHRKVYWIKQLSKYLTFTNVSFTNFFLMSILSLDNLDVHVIGSHNTD